MNECDGILVLRLLVGIFCKRWKDLFKIDRVVPVKTFNIKVGEEQLKETVPNIWNLNKASIESEGIRFWVYW